MGIGYGKLLLFGEHAVVHGYPAVGIGCDRRTAVTFDGEREPGDSSATIAIADRQVVACGLAGEDAAAFARAVECGVSAVGRSKTPGFITIESDLPAGVGLGSSAALAAAIAFETLAPAKPDGSGDRTEHDKHMKRRVWELAHDIERIYHGTPSGIDTALAVYRGTLAAYPEPPGPPRLESLDPQSDMVIVYGYIPRTRATGTLVASIRNALETGDSATRDALEALGSLSRRAIEMLGARCADAGAFGELAEEAHRQLRSLGLSTPELEECLAAGRRAGALGGKLSGAGGGGAWFLVFDERPRAEAALRELGARLRGVPLSILPISSADSPASPRA